MMSTQRDPLTWLAPGERFPNPSEAWDENSPAPGLLAAGGALDVETLRRAYSAGIFPWYSDGQPILWWSPNPRMVLRVADFKLHPSFKKTLQRFGKTPGCEVRIDSAFRQVIESCATSPRDSQAGTWILPAMIEAYCELHQAGLAHSVETWINGKLSGGLYCVSMGGAVFGESMFSTENDASKIALAALVGFCRHHKIIQIDCQQNTRHLASLGACEVSRDQFIQGVSAGLAEPGPVWQFNALHWQEILNPRPA
jgi:leucyl/phenylalanyl-tRNA--protein transferase